MRRNAHRAGQCGRESPSLMRTEYINLPTWTEMECMVRNQHTATGGPKANCHNCMRPIDCTAFMSSTYMYRQMRLKHEVIHVPVFCDKCM
mmetsp:Transcript_19225/g.33149  ORF Transcript_19225/g.33149 Transcript_19225/m.33149 type:complete len:90 (+) Transcript_19225:770-1039(+)